MKVRKFWIIVLTFSIVLVSFSGSFAETEEKNILINDTIQKVDATAFIQIDTDGTSSSFNTYLYGTNAPAWLNPWRFGDQTFQERTAVSGTTLIRMPGGSWSNAYDWLACERGGQGIDQNAACYWTWASRPTDFINYLRATGIDGMWTVNQGGTSKEAAALVAFFNGSVNDHRVIGVDVRGRNWGKVSDWAALRRDNGNPEPFYVEFWEIGNETFGGTSGTDCIGYGWENDVWTCDGREYVLGIGSGGNRKEGFLEFYSAMKAVDSSIQIGAVGVSYQDGWSNWGNEVIQEAGSVMDFYIVHEYGYWNAPSSFSDVLSRPQQVWGPIMVDIRSSFNQYANGRQVPVAVTEHNMFSFYGMDYSEWMSCSVNSLFIADTIGQMAEHGYAMANQWNIANDDGYQSRGYGMMLPADYHRTPQYYVFPLWSGFGTQMVPVSSSLPEDTTLSVYAGLVDSNTVSLLAVNKTESSINSQIQIDGVNSITGGSIDALETNSFWDMGVTYNGVSNPSNDLSNAPSGCINGSGNPMSYTFPPRSVTLLRIDVSDELPFSDPPTGDPPPPVIPATDFLYMPLVSNSCY